MLLESKLNRPVTGRLLMAGTAFATSAALLYFGTGLHPISWLTWLAFLPVLLLAPRVPAGTAAATAFAAWLAGGTNLWSYMMTVRIPAALIAGYAVVPALLFALAVLLARALLARRWLMLAAIATPACWAATEYLFSVLTPNGAFWGLSYTQSNILPVMQTASATGPWGVTFLLVAASAATAAALAPGARPWARARPVAAFTVMLSLALGYGTAQLHTTVPAARSVRVALVAASQPGGRIDIATPQGNQMLSTYLQKVGELIRSGAQVIVLPEAVFAASPSTIARITAPFARLAARTGATIVVGAAVVTDSNGNERGYNTAQIFSGTAPVSIYRKQHLILGAETRKYQPGHDLGFVPRSAHQLGVEICMDMDYPALARTYRQHGARLMLVPAWDFGTDGWLHGRMAVSRGIENGFAVARSARNGRATISDSTGQILADADTSTGTAHALVSVTATVPLRATSTLYTRYGDWFAWLSIIITLAAGLCLTARRPTPRRRHTTATAGAERLQGDRMTTLQHEL